MNFDVLEPGKHVVIVDNVFYSTAQPKQTLPAIVLNEQILQYFNPETMELCGWDKLSSVVGRIREVWEIHRGPGGSGFSLTAFKQGEQFYQSYRTLIWSSDPPTKYRRVL